MRSLIIYAIVIGRTINIGGVLRDSIGNGNVAGSVCGIGIRHRIRQRLSRLYLIAVNGITISIKDIFFGLRLNNPYANKVCILMVNGLRIVVIPHKDPCAFRSLYASLSSNGRIGSYCRAILNPCLLTGEKVENFLRKLFARGTAYKFVVLCIQQIRNNFV